MNDTTLEPSERTNVHRCRQRLDSSAATGITRTLRAAGPGGEVVLDLGAVNAFDAAGVAVIVRAVRCIWRSGGSVRIVDARPHLGNMLSLTGMDRMALVECTAGGRAP